MRIGVDQDGIRAVREGKQAGRGDRKERGGNAMPAGIQHIKPNILRIESKYIQRITREFGARPKRPGEFQ